MTAACRGAQASEVAGLRVVDIDSTRGATILVRHGKGAKDRNVMLSAQLLGITASYWRLARPTIYLFPGRDEGVQLIRRMSRRLPISGQGRCRFDQAGHVARATP